MRNIYYQDDSFCFAWSEFAGDIFIHCDVYSWKPSVYKRGLSVFNTFLKDFSDKGIHTIYTVTPNPKFAELMAGEKLVDTIIDGKEYEVFKWVLKQQSQV